jgi:hypothetical protein
MTTQHDTPIEALLKAAYAARLARIDESALHPIPKLDTTTGLTPAAVDAFVDRRQPGHRLLVLAAACFAVIVSLAIALATTGGDHHSPARPGHRAPTPTTPTTTSGSSGVESSSSPSHPETTSGPSTTSGSTGVKSSSSPSHSETTSGPSTSATPVIGAARWNGAVLVITGHSLGGVRIGMTRSQAARAAGVPSFVPVGDGAYGPSDRGPSSDLYLYLSHGAAMPPSFRGDFTCLGAGLTTVTPTQIVTTEQGLHLGDRASRVHAIYGSKAIFMPAAASGMDPRPGYVVHQGRYDLIFKLDAQERHVIYIAGGFAPLTPNDCSG